MIDPSLLLPLPSLLFIVVPFIVLPLLCTLLSAYLVHPTYTFTLPLNFRPNSLDLLNANLSCFSAVSGIGHKIKSVNNPDLRVELVKEYVRKNFPSHSLLDYALAVEKVTTAKKDTVR